MSRLRVAFAGSPAFAVPSLQATAKHCDIKLVLTQPDRPAGRGRALKAPEVKLAALDLGLEVSQPLKIKDPSALHMLRELELDLMVVVAYGQIFPLELLEMPRFGCINVHGSLLPRWRGAAPIQRAVLAGDEMTGVCIMQLEQGCDTGPVFCEAKIPIEDGQSSGALFERLSHLGADLLGEFLQNFAARGEPTLQDPSLVTHAAKLSKEESPVDWHQPAFLVARHIAGMDPWPGATAVFRGASGGEQALKLFAARAQTAPPQSAIQGPAGTVVAWDRDQLWVACADAPVAIGAVQAPGKRRMSAADYRGGAPFGVGDVAVVPV